ncbi:flavodoxin domain-containing protein [Gymnodinialimonas sp.]
MKVFIGYATTEGQSRKVARWASDRLVDDGHSVELMALADGDDLDLSRFDRAVLIASIHASHYQSSLAEFVTQHDAWLGTHPALFLSLSLAAAGHDAEDWRTLDKIAADFSAATGWTPGVIEHVAGAYKPSQYDILKRFIMRRIVAAKNPEADPNLDHEYTDWDGLADRVDQWMAS